MMMMMMMMVISLLISQQEVEELRRKRNTIAATMKEKITDSERKTLIESGKLVKTALVKLEKEFEEIEDIHIIVK